MLSCSFLLNTVILSRLNWLCRLRPDIARNIRIKKRVDELSIIGMDRGILGKNGETGDANNYDYMNMMEMCYSMCKLFLSGSLFLEPKYSETSASSGTPTGKS